MLIHGTEAFLPAGRSLGLGPVAPHHQVSALLQLLDVVDLAGRRPRKDNAPFAVHLGCHDEMIPPIRPFVNFGRGADRSSRVVR